MLHGSYSLVAVVDFGSSERHDDFKLPWGTAMSKKLFGLVIVAAAVVGAAAVLTATPAQAQSCPSGYHRVHCPHSSFCCPDTVMCDCLP